MMVARLLHEFCGDSVKDSTRILKGFYEDSMRILYNTKEDYIAVCVSGLAGAAFGGGIPHNTKENDIVVCVPKP